MGIKLVDLLIEYGPGEKERHQLVYSSAVKPIPEQTQGDPRRAAAHDKVLRVPLSVRQAFRLICVRYVYSNCLLSFQASLQPF